MSVSPLNLSPLTAKIVSPCRSCENPSPADGCTFSCSRLAAFRRYLAAYHDFTLNCYEASSVEAYRPPH